MLKSNNSLISGVLISLLIGSIYSISYSEPAAAATGDSDTTLVLNGTNQYVEVTDNGTSAFDLAGTVTMQAWVYATSACTNSGGQGIVTKDVSYMLYCNSGKWAYAYSGNGTSWIGVATTMPVEQNAWHHIAFTKASTSYNSKFYYDGQNVETNTAHTPLSMTPNNNAFKIGQFAGTNFFSGRIDEVRIYSTQRTDAQILADMNNWGPANESGLVAYYDFNDVSGSSITNKVSTPASGTTLTAYNSPTYSAIESSTVINGDQVITFPRSYLVANGGWKIPSHVSTVKSLVVAGGGAGGSRAGGGGGSGGYVYDSALSVTPNSYQPIIVGQGGGGMANMAGFNGNNSSLGALRTALGGGGGGHAGGSDNVARAGRDGGSGGGASGDHNLINSSAAYGLGNQNSTYGYGSGYRGGSGYSNGAWPSGGGGGAGGVGANSNGPSNIAGKGGAGISDPIGGTSICYATGAGGGVLSGYTKGEGGDCGVTTSPNNNAGLTVSSLRGAPAAKANTGSGGAGNGYNASGADYEGGNGASGVIVLRYSLLTDVSLSFSGGAQGAYRTLGTITATATLSGKVTFYERGKIIPGCKNKATNGSLAATCSWRPSTRGNVSISATNKPTNSYVSNATTSLKVFVTTRTGART